MNYKRITLCVLLAFSGATNAQNAAREVVATTPTVAENASLAVMDVQIQNADPALLAEMAVFARGRLVGKGPKSLADLNRVASDMTDVFFKQRGEMFSRVYLPVQTISATHSVLTFAVLQGTLGKLSIEGVAPCYVAQISKRLGVREGDVLNVTAFERGLLLIEDFPGVRIEQVLTTPGAKTGQSDYTIKLKQENAITGVALLDNQGSNATGINRFTTQAAWANPAGIGDELEVGVTHSGKGLTAARVAYSVPFSIKSLHGWKASVSVNNTNYRLVGESLSALDAHGEARGVNAAITYPLIRTQDTNIGLLTQFTKQNMIDDVLGLRLNDKSSKSFVLGASGDMSKNWFAKAGSTSVNWTAAATVGNIAIKNEDARIADMAGPNTASGFERLNGSFSVTQQLAMLSPSLSIHGAVTGQYSKTNLDSSEKFVMTGPSAVRGFAQGEVTGDKGVFGTAELRYRLEQRGNFSVSTYGFYDQGHATIWADKWTMGRNKQTVKAAGLGITTIHKNGFFVTATISKGWGLKDDNVNHDDTFAWVQAGMRF